VERQAESEGNHMQVRKLGVVAAAAGLLGGTLLLTASASADRRGSDADLKLIAVTTESGGAGEEVGDTFAFGGDIFAVSRSGRSIATTSSGSHREPIGRFGVSCVVTSVEEEEANCSGSLTVEQRGGDDGMITVQALLSSSGDDEEEDATMARGSDDRDKGDEWAITGGTDDFDGAGGTLTTIDVSDEATLLLFEFSD
jgi:hypothetical protein